MVWEPTPQACEDYLHARQGCYEYRCERYSAAADFLYGNGLTDQDIVCDVGAGYTEFDYYLRTNRDFKGRYYPVDGGLGGEDLNSWTPKREIHWFVALEIIEHLSMPHMFSQKLQMFNTKGICISTPNSAVVDTLAMDQTHRTALYKEDLENYGYNVEVRSFCGQPDDSLFAWRLV